MTIIAPSVLSLDYSNVNEQMNKLNNSKAQWIHFDVMDGHFVPNLSFGPDILKGLKKLTSKFFDVHIMVDNPVYFAKVFKEAGADLITFHYEACNSEQIKEICTYLKDNNVKVGISIKPKTPVHVLKDIIKDFDLVLIMSVEPGFGGQKFDESSLDKIKYLRNLIDSQGYNCLIQVDGGINESTALRVKEAGCDVLVAGSYIFNGDIESNVESLL